MEEWQGILSFTSSWISHVAGKRTIKPDRKWQDEIYSAVFVLVPVEHNTDIGIRNIETSYYEQKTFWSFCNYMVRSCKGIEMLVNLINVSYGAMKILPYQNEHFSEYRTKSVQEFRFELSQGIHSQIFFTIFVKNIETHIKSNAMTKALKQLIHQQVYHL